MGEDDGGGWFAPALGAAEFGTAGVAVVSWGWSLLDVDIPFGRRREQDCQAQRRLRAQVQVSPASVVTELDAVVGVALEAVHDDDAISSLSWGRWSVSTVPSCV